MHTAPTAYACRRASLITGLTPGQHGLVTYGGILPADVPTLPAALAAAGWRTHAVGRLHLLPAFHAHFRRPIGAPRFAEVLRQAAGSL